MALKILLAEDEEALSRVYKAALEHQGFEVDQAFNGQKAVDLAAQNAYQVIIMDIMMPIKTGIEALKEIRSSGNTTHVIMLTAMAEVDDRVTGLDAGADDYLTKPISLKELVTLLVDNANKYCDSEGTVTVRLRQVGRTRKRARLLEVAGVARDIADPWYTGDFDATYRDVTLGCNALLEQLKKEL